MHSGQTYLQPPSNLPPRAQRGRIIADTDGAVKRLGVEQFKVKAQSKLGHFKVGTNGPKWHCDCPDFKKRGMWCKHIYATRYYLTIVRDTPEGPVEEKIPVTKKQAWSAYNKAQKEEIEIFDQLLRELVSSIPEPIRKGAGRPSLSIQEQLFCAIQKVYSQLSSRRAHSLFRAAVCREQLSHAPHYNAVSKFLLRDEVTAILKNLVTESAKPLAEMEKDFAIDSSGFRTRSFGAYCREKHGTKREHRWLKAHICSGVYTNIVTDITITEANGADSPQFEGLVRRTADGFEIREVSADKAYSSRANHDIVGEVGGFAYIPFRSNATGKSRGSKLWQKAFHYFQLNRDDFERHYHKRSNVETTFGAIKQKFGECLKSKKPRAQVNELLCKIIAYNITVLIHEMFEHDISPDFSLTDRNN